MGGSVKLNETGCKISDWAERKCQVLTLYDNLYSASFYTMLLFNSALLFLFNTDQFYMKWHHWLHSFGPNATQCWTRDHRQFVRVCHDIISPHFFFFTKLPLILLHFPHILLHAEVQLFTFDLSLTSGLTATSNRTAWEHKKFYFSDDTVTCYVYKVARYKLSSSKITLVSQSTAKASDNCNKLL
jgi:hypothetical protein